MERFEVVTDNGGELVQIRNIHDGDTCWILRKRLRRNNGAWVLVSERRAMLAEFAKNRKLAKAAKKIENEVAA